MSKSVLVVEDEKPIAKIISTILKRENFLVSIAFSGNDALEKLALGFKPDIISTDILMPGISGLELLKYVKSSEKFYETPVVVVSAISHKNIVASSAKLGANAYIRKPFLPKDYINIIKKNLI